MKVRERSCGATPRGSYTCRCRMRPSISIRRKISTAYAHAPKTPEIVAVHGTACPPDELRTHNAPVKGANVRGVVHAEHQPIFGADHHPHRHRSDLDVRGVQAPGAEQGWFAERHGR